jgi:hypothetical protein
MIYIKQRTKTCPARTPDRADIDRVDLKRFAASSYLSVAYDYVFQVGQCWNYSEYDNHNIIAFSDGVTPAASYGDISPFLMKNSKCRHVVDLAIGRWNLEAGDNRQLTIRQLALLAGMSEAAVRNSLSVEKIRTPVEAQIAKEWLQGRKGFSPTRSGENQSALWQAHTRRLLDSQSISVALETILADLKLSSEAAAEKAGVRAKAIHKLLAESYSIEDITTLKKIGEVLDLDVPHFIGRAIEAALRKAA